MKAASAMTREVVCIAPADELDAAWAMMTRMRIRHLPVLDGNELVGILSDRDVLVRATYTKDGEILVPAVPVKNAMTPAPITCHPTATISHVVDLMLDNKIDCVPVVESHKRLMGLVTSADLLELLRTRERDQDKIIPFDFKVRTNALSAVV